jgi:hypothetical protein
MEDCIAIHGAIEIRLKQARQRGAVRGHGPRGDVPSLAVAFPVVERDDLTIRVERRISDVDLPT